ncbi:MAG: CPBP family intramembrane metalloprotease [Microbacterium sp.]|jgi:membrane protease YdiL (CAAX protease family)|nr:CPBP family intramembrane metalloprotease [Microbacterium sp.]
MSLKQSPTALDALTGKRVTPWWLAYIITLLCIFAVQVGGIALFNGILQPKEGSPEAQWAELGADALVILAVFLWVWLYERRSIKTLGFRNPGKGVLKLLLGIVIGAVVISLPVLVLWASGGYQLVDGPSGSFSGGPALALVLALVLAFVVQGGSEEVLMRGFLTQNNATKFPAWLAILLPAFFFTILHGVLNKPLAFIVIFGFAVTAALVMFWQRSLWLIAGFHAGWNWAMGNIWGIPVSGLPGKDVSLVYLSPAEGAPDWLTGGEFGTEASLPAAMMMIIVTAIAFLLFRKASRTWPDAPAVSEGGANAAAA